MQGKNRTRQERERVEEGSWVLATSRFVVRSPTPLGSCYQSTTFDRIRRGVSTTVAAARIKNALLLSGAGVTAGSFFYRSQKSTIGLPSSQPALFFLVTTGRRRFFLAGVESGCK
ncbi:unnamed protein product [Linum trigynum]|uniref:Uncharacterized protein n=1 Tax=Linum trigynum TaxID=586398 RepID=A0AAV2DT82_9ROSI